MDIQTKQQALDLFEKTRTEFLAHCRWLAKRIAQDHNGFVNIDQVREQVITPEGVNPKVYGAVFHTDEFEFSTYKITERKSSHGRPVSVWYWKAYKPLNRRQEQVEGNLTFNI